MPIAELIQLGAPLYEKDAPPETRDDLRANLSVLSGKAVAFDRELEAASSDRDLSSDGQFNRKKRAADALDAALKTFETSKIDGIEHNAALVYSEIVAKSKPERPSDVAERVSYAALLSEIRAGAPADRLEREQLYETTDDPLVIDAYESAPKVLNQARPGALRTYEPFIDPAKVTAARLARVEAKDPGLVAKHRALVDLAALYRSLVSGLRNAAYDQVGTPREAVKLVSRGRR